MKKLITLSLITFIFVIPFIQAQETIQKENKENKAEKSLPPIKIPKYIVDPYSGVMVNAKDAFFVYNCNRYGTMQDYFGFAQEVSAKDYAKKNNCGVLNYEGYKKALKKDNRLIEE